MYEINGTLKLISDAQTFASGFSKREFVVTTSESKYPQDLKFEVVKEKCSVIDEFNIGQNVKVSFYIRGNEYNGKYYVSLSCWKLESTHGVRDSTPETRRNKAKLEVYNEDDNDDIPF
jgi:hypothetical protein